jgi:serine protease Do
VPAVPAEPPVQVPAGAPVAPVQPEAAAPQPSRSPAEEKALARALEIESELIDSLDRVRKSSVSVLHFRKMKPDGQLCLVGVGSGVLVAQRGLWVVTNVHVVQGSDAVQIVAIDGKRYPMKIEDMVEEYDMALLGFEGSPPRGLKGVPVRASASGSGLSEGTWVVATGNPFFLAIDGQPVATLGVVSGLDRILGKQFLYGKAIQHDAEVNPGNSGGPLWNLRGDFLGINGMIAATGSQGEQAHNTGAAFSIPAEQVARYLGKMIDKKTDAKAGHLGVVFETATDSDGNPLGAVVKQSSMDKDKKGLQVGDIIYRFGERGKSSTVIRTASDLTNALSLCLAGTTVRVTYHRGKRSDTWEGPLQGK